MRVSVGVMFHPEIEMGWFGECKKHVTHLYLDEVKKSLIDMIYALTYMESLTLPSISMWSGY